ncbi:hypothetical protein H9Q13_07045 [Pontibacter sp. JH31]|uniref:Outer membrane protein beta-barrel domain-containing protein n=1 Tax=Pontibacter aquaedesilientis TaxID=2766980 RepID=A0ABR7XG57_9BACT|nr:hypothetical protein [Pontibacter aquaedesilientis]MBD1396916.1 hypothetical protein [Pontibacter aquaedesilientis]
MKIFITTLLGCSLLFAGTAIAQTSEGQQKASLEAAPTPALQEQPAPQAESKPSMLVMPSNRISYSLSAGASFGNGFGATYLEPTVRYQVSPRLRVFSSMTYLSVMSQQYTDVTPEGGTIMRRTSPSSHFIMHAGADYLVNNRLILSGSVWKDFSNIPAQNPAYSNFMTPGRQGMDFRATYKITDHFSVTGGMRYSDGASPFYGPFSQPASFGRSGAFWY